MSSGSSNDDGAQEVAILDKVLLRLAMADNAEAAAPILATFLVPALQLLAAPQAAVKKKVVALVGHINSRFPSSPAVFPLMSLVDQYIDASVPPLVKNLTLVYLNKALAPVALVHALVSPAIPANHRNAILHIMAPHLACAAPQPEALPPAGALEAVVDFGHDLLLFRPQDIESQTAQRETGAPLPEPPPGLSRMRCKRLASLKPANPSHLSACQASILSYALDVAAADAGWLQAVFPMALVAAHSANPTARDLASHAMRSHFPPSTFSPTSVVTLDRLCAYVAGDSSERVRPASIDLALAALTHLANAPDAALAAPRLFDTLRSALLSPQARMTAAGKALFQALFRTAEPERLVPLARALLDMLLPSIAGTGLGSFGYVAVGRCARIVPSLVGPNLRVLASFFDAAESGSASDRAAVKEALTDLMGAFDPLPESAQGPVFDVLEKYAASGAVQARLMALFYVMHLFPFAHLPSRLLCARLASDTNLAVANEAERGLRPYINMGAGVVPDTSVAYPDFGATAAHFALHGAASPESLVHGFGFCAAAYNAWRKNDANGSLPPDAQPLVALLVEALGRFGEARPALQAQAVSVLAGMADAWARPETVELVPASAVLPLCAAAKAGVREDAARVLAALAPVADPGAVLGPLLEGLVPEASEEAKHGRLVAAAGAAAALLRVQASGLAATSEPLLQVTALAELAAEWLAAGGKNVSPLVGAALCRTLGELGSLMPLPLSGGAAAREATVGQLLALVPQGTAATSSSGSSLAAAMHGAALRALGQVCVGEPHAAYESAVIDACFTLGRVKAVGLQLGAAHTMACVLLGSDTSALDAGAWTVVREKSEAETSFVVDLLKRILVDGVGSGHSFLRQAATLWLVQCCESASRLADNAGARTVLASHIVDVQAAFEYALTDRDLFTQEAASTGLSLTYQLSTETSTQERLLAGLVKTLSTGAGNATTKMAVQAGEPLFQAEALGLTPDGGSLATYQEICSLATDVGQPELIYKFMGLARSNALWTSRTGAASGFAALAESETARAALVDLVPALAPKLFRYRFDPDERVQASMARIWKALVGVVAEARSESSVQTERMIVAEQFDEVLSSALEGIGQRAWRVREASVLALGALLETSPPLTTVQARLEEMWTMAFRALDDIKESVRLAALKACSSLGKVTLQFCSPEAAAEASGACPALDIMMPFLLEKGLVSDAKPVQAFSLSLIVRIVKKARELLKPHLPALVGTLLRAMSTLEPQEFNYVTLNKDRYNLTTEQVEGARLAMAKASPISRTLEAAVGFADAPTLERLVPELVGVITRGVGLPTKVGAAKLVMDLVEMLATEVTPYCKRLMKALMRALHDSSPGMRAANAMALGFCARHAKTKTLARTLGQLVDEYMAATPDSEVQGTVGMVLMQMSKAAPGRLKTFGADVLPVCLVAMHNGREETAKLFRAVWEENTSGNTGGVRLYADELVALVTRALVADQWPLRKQAAASLSFMATAAPTALAGVECGAEGVLAALEAGLAGRLWDGKEALVEAYVDVALLLAKADRAALAAAPAVVDGVLEQAVKRKAVYRYAVTKIVVKAVRYYATAVDARTGLAIHAAVVAALSEMAFTSFEDVDKPGSKPRFLATQAEVLHALGASYPLAAEAQEPEPTAELVASLAAVVAGNPWIVRNAALGALAKIIERGAGCLATASGAVAAANEAAIAALDEAQFKSVREAGLALATILVDALPRLGAAGEPVREPLEAALRRREQDAEVAIARGAKQVRQALQTQG
ncbi:uncharacterized protein AMSG_09939 [Thecamonas trahens ATCC 50062]|uniref:Uncharacterized protein n=1 Tax=Thecamonas trahens ATCC 50062 TaxID=461836 RepID=A0A0L0DPC9_THETB|nr:hypothetical protein AMSG_09939 [Thecamonas trahens ATCC 50062]KNC54159.1 hypothetical protein AMSG_09939 [Thecamonas trahens ATCC 50062]|eukprot:XP_013753980.1 hypothetical protein AMSG_09939 [Thecamonas trahens ATCC 50062]